MHTLTVCLLLHYRYHIYKKLGMVTCFQDMLDNIFLPLFEATRDKASHPQLARFLTYEVPDSA